MNHRFVAISKINSMMSIDKGYAGKLTFPIPLNQQWIYEGELNSDDGYLSFTRIYDLSCVQLKQ